MANTMQEAKIDCYEFKMLEQKISSYKDDPEIPYGVMEDRQTVSDMRPSNHHKKKHVSTRLGVHIWEILFD
ncbi:Protein CHUP1, chloroplastic [Sesbania bispinosa]|nr:Protein CHUP1, chloroplastic [Sesbania bispinosa]